MRRFAMDKLLDWKKKSNRKPLILMGARQVGKTWLMKEFGKTYYEKTAYISFYNNQRMQAVFDTDFDIKRIIMNLNIESGVTITPENTLIVLDEIQNAPKALESLKYFCEEAPEYHVIAAGSLLGVALHEGISYPVGKVDLLDLYPFNFREFLCAMDEEGLEYRVILYGSMRVILESTLKQKFSQEYEWYGILFRCSWRRRIKNFSLDR